MFCFVLSHLQVCSLSVLDMIHHRFIFNKEQECKSEKVADGYTAVCKIFKCHDECVLEYVLGSGLQENNYYYDGFTGYLFNFLLKVLFYSQSSVYIYSPTHLLTFTVSFICYNT